MSILSDIGSPGRTCPSDSAPPVNPRLADLETTFLRKVFVRTHHLFRWLLVAQWVGGVALAQSVGARYFSHPIIFSLLAGGLLTVPALLLIRSRPTAVVTRVTVACSQAGFSLLFVALCGGRPEAYFAAFASLGFLSLYRDWRLQVVAVATMVLGHVPGILWAPAAVFGSGDATLWSWLAFAGVALGWGSVVCRREAREICTAQEQHQQLLAGLEQRVRERTRALETEIAERERATTALRRSEQQHRELISRLPIGVFETSRSGKVRFANAHALSLVGLPAHIDATAITLADGRIFPFDGRERLWARLENHGEVRGYAATLLHFDGSPFDVVINARLKATLPGEELCAEGTFEDVTVRKRAERELEGLHGQLVLASRQAGMAEVANGVLHNVGNVLTSVNLIVHDVQDRLKATRLSHLHRVVEILERERGRLGEFLTQDPNGRQVPDFLAKLDAFLVQENQQLLTDVDGLVRHFEHIREIIITQQGSAQLFGVIEPLVPAQLFEDALRLNADSRERHGITLERDFEPVGSIKADRHKVLQILVNLMKNAKDALQVRKAGERQIRVRVAGTQPGRIALSVEDNGAGIAVENLTRIFQHGYTTKTTGHGFGLHSSVLAAREMGGDLTATSAGLGRGSTFTLTLPGASDS